MMKVSSFRALAVVGTVALAASAAHAQLNLGLPPGVGGSAGPFNPGASLTIDLANAQTGVWNQPGTGAGIYDPAQWAVVYHYSEVNIPAGVTVSFENHPSTAPVVWIVDGPVVINGTVNLDGKAGSNAGAGVTAAEPGPGGFRGGFRSQDTVQPSAGFGPGGGGASTNESGGNGGSYGTTGGIGASNNSPAAQTYGSQFIIPLIGGSGGAGANRGNNATGGGGGGGAILIVSSSQITVNGQIRARGGNGGACNSNIYIGGGGSGGAIRLVAETVDGTGSLLAAGGTAACGAVGSRSGGVGGVGRVSIEAFSIGLPGGSQPSAVTSEPLSPVRIFPDSTAPRVRVLTVGGEAVVDDPTSNLGFPADVSFDTDGLTEIVIEANNVPLGSVVLLRVVPKTGQSFTVEAQLVGGNDKFSTWQAAVNVANGFSTIQARAVLP